MTAKTNDHIRLGDRSKIYFDEFSSRVVAQSGRPGDRFHLGKLILQGFKDAPEFTLQIDGVTNESETFGSALYRSTRCATAFRATGIELGDVIVLMAPNHVHLSVPFYAALYLGVAVLNIYEDRKGKELQSALSVSRPKAIFCQSEKVQDIQEALNKVNLDARIVTFNNNETVCSLQEFMDKYGGTSSSADFKAEDFDTEETVAFLATTSGTTASPKFATLTHKNIAVSTPTTGRTWFDNNFETPTRLVFISSPLLWLSAILKFTGLPIYRITRLQSSVNVTAGVFNRLVKTYKPSWMVISPTLLTQAMGCKDSEKFDLTSFKTVFMTGSAVNRKFIDELYQHSPGTMFYNGYGITETSGPMFLQKNPRKAAACGQPNGVMKYRIVNPETGITIDKPNVPGELWLKGPGIFKGYCKNPEATAEVITEDRWFRTGDIFFREEDETYHFVERSKLVLKYKNHQRGCYAAISPEEIEEVIRQHPSVQDTAVSSVPDAAFGDLPVACVVRRSGCSVTAQEIKEHVKDNLTEQKQLHGGVIFLDQLPMTASTKIDRRKLKEIILTMKRE